MMCLGFALGMLSIDLSFDIQDKNGIKQMVRLRA